MAPTESGTTAPPRSKAIDLVLVVDAGGTKTAAWLAGRASQGPPGVLGRGRTTAGNPLTVGFSEATRAIAEAVERACRDADCSNAAISRAVLSIAGASDAELHDKIVEWARKIGVAERVAVVSDVLPVLAAATPDCRGIALVSGTGSVAFGRTADDRTTICGGWGYLLGDDGSGFAIGRAALRFALEGLEVNAEPRPLTRLLLGEMGVSSVAAVKRAIYTQPDPRAAIAALATRLIVAADAGDADARVILDVAARDLAVIVNRVARSLGLSDLPCTLAMAGGVLVGSKRLQSQILLELQEKTLECELRIVEEPLNGCLRLADEGFTSSMVTWH